MLGCQLVQFAESVIGERLCGAWIGCTSESISRESSPRFSLYCGSDSVGGDALQYKLDSTCVYIFSLWTRPAGAFAVTWRKRGMKMEWKSVEELKSRGRGGGGPETCRVE